jgi:hypothetical protein
MERPPAGPTTENGGNEDGWEMTDTQIYIAIGVPILVNIIFNGTIAMLMSNHFNALLAAMQAEFRALLEVQQQLFTEKLRRVEEIIDARLKHLEDR